MPDHRLNKEQARAVRDIDHNLCVVAGAGCGKTTVLVERYIHTLAADRERKVANLAAITFTENAASQMRNRIRRECLGRIAAGDAMERQRWLRRKRDLDAAPVSTFHAFCGSILRRYAIEAGVDPGFTILDEVAGALMRADAVSGTIKDLIDADDANLVLLLRHHSLYTIRGMVTTLVGESERFTSMVEKVLKKSDEEIIKKISAEVLKAKREAAEALLADPECRSAVGILHSHQGREGDKLEARRADVLDAIARLRKASSGPQLDDAVTHLFSFDRRRVGSAKSWRSADVVETVRQACKTIVDLRDTYLKDVR
ncbi:MAG: UvrD-helicase domain-containing protein, partial [Phycisphaerae bacterium]|nr:UvrD-helicase domain-containing protein [Phycisphaerae bacterium]